MDFVYAVFMVVGQGWSFINGLYPLQIENCPEKIKEMTPVIQEIYNQNEKITDFEMGCIKADSYEHLRDILKERYPPGDPA